MFFPLDFWIRVGNFACAPSRKKRGDATTPTVSEAEALRIVGEELCSPFVPRPEAIEAHRKVVEVALSIDKKVHASDKLIAVANALFQKDHAAALRTAREQSLLCRQPIADLQRLLQSPEWQMPVSIDTEMEHPELARLKQLGLVIQLRAIVLWLAQDEQGALEQLGTAMLLAHRIQDCDGLFIHELIGTTLKTRVSRIIRMGLSILKSSDSFLSELDSLLVETEPISSRHNSLFNREFRFCSIPGARLRSSPWKQSKIDSVPKQFGQSLIAQELLIEWTIRNHPNPVNRRARLKELRRCYVEISRDLSSGWAVAATLKRLSHEYGKDIPTAYKQIFMDDKKGVSIPAAISASRSFHRIDDIYGRLGMYRLLDMSAKMVIAAFRCEAELSATRICIAAERLLARGMSGPLDSLYTLVNAGFLDSIPLDPTSGQPFRFDPETQSVWVPGPINMTFDQAYAARRKGGNSWWWSLWGVSTP